MIKRFTTILVISVMIIASLCPIANAAPPENNHDISVLTLTNHEYCIDSNDVKYTKKYLNTFVQGNITDLSKYDIIQLTGDDTDSLLKKGCLSKIMQLVDNGVIFYIQDGKLKEEDLAKKFSIPYEGKSYVKGGTKLGIALMRVNNNYIFENQFFEEGHIGYSNDVELSSGATPTIAPSSYTASSNDVVQSNGITLFKKICGSNSIEKIVFNNRKGIYDTINEMNQTNEESDKLNLQSLPSGYTYYNNSNKNIVYPNTSTVVGWEHITQYIFVRNTQTSGGNTYKIFDTTTRFTAGANDKYYVTYYKCRIHSNITNHEVIDHTRLNSNTSSSQSLSLSGGYSKNGVNIGGGASTSWTWTPDSQNITNYFPTTPYREWRVTPVAARLAESWLIEPGIRSVNTAAQSGKSGAFSSFRQIDIGGGYGVSSTTVFEIGRLLETKRNDYEKKFFNKRHYNNYDYLFVMYYIEL